MPCRDMVWIFEYRARINDLESQTMDGKLMFVDDNGKPQKMLMIVNADSDSEMDEVFNETTSFMASTSSEINESGSGVRIKSMYEQWKKTYNEDSYDDDDFDDCGLTDAQMKFANSLDTSFRGQLK
nr:hypothetical protein [Tanacetum cinerariifolium]GFA16056.1 hypothetical protein [Tanacetum cinerariifolium]